MSGDINEYTYMYVMLLEQFTCVFDGNLCFIYNTNTLLELTLNSQVERNRLDCLCVF